MNIAELVNKSIVQLNRIVGLGLKEDLTPVEFLDQLEEMEPIANISESIKENAKITDTIQNEILEIKTSIEGLTTTNNTDLVNQITELKNSIEKVTKDTNDNFKNIAETINKLKENVPTKVLDTSNIQLETETKETETKEVDVRGHFKNLNAGIFTTTRK